LVVEETWRICKETMNTTGSLWMDNWGRKREREREKKKAHTMVE
jgi:hypothetical protein